MGSSSGRASVSRSLVVFALIASVSTSARAAERSRDSSWTETGSLNTARSDHSATLLPSGKVLVVGGVGWAGHLGVNAELYDPGAGTWTTASSLDVAGGGRGHTATLLPSGHVLVAGGTFVDDACGCDRRSAAAELYDPETDRWTSTGSLNTVRSSHKAVLLLSSSKVLVVGGFNDSEGAELYDPETGNWTRTGSLNTGRWLHTVTLLPSGKVLVAGGRNGLASAEVYDPETGTWTFTGSLNEARSGHTATLLHSGSVLVAGGDNSSTGALTSAELYDFKTGTWTTTGSLTIEPHVDHTATLLLSGEVLVATGGGYGSTLASSAELYDPDAGTWSGTAWPNQARSLHTATLLDSGRVLVAGGYGSTYYLASSELFSRE